MKEFADAAITGWHHGKFGRRPQAVRFAAAAHVPDFLAIVAKSMARFEDPRRAWQEACEAAGIGVQDLDSAEVRDYFPTAEFLVYEANAVA